MLLKNHLFLYPTTGSINYFFNLGFTISVLMIIQILSGLLLTLYYLNHNNGYYSIVMILLDINYGFCLRYVHNNNTSLLMIAIFMHVYRNLMYKIYFNSYVFNAGMLIIYVLMAELFLGYLLVFGQISYWGATVIINLLSFVPDFIEWISGDFMITLKTIKRFFIIHFILGLAVIAFMVVHFFHLHTMGSNNVFIYIINNKISIFFYLIKDFLGLIAIYGFITSQYFLMWLKFAHNDNMVEVNTLVTPTHIIPEWYFLPLYFILKIIPHRTSGFILMICMLSAYLLLEIPRCQGMQDVHSSRRPLMILHLGLLVIITYLGAQLPQPILISYGRIIVIAWFVILIYLLPVYKR